LPDVLREREGIGGCGVGVRGVCAEDFCEETFVLGCPFAVALRVGLDARGGHREALAGERGVCERGAEFFQADARGDRGEDGGPGRGGSFWRRVCRFGAREEAPDVVGIKSQLGEVTGTG